MKRSRLLLFWCILLCIPVVTVVAAEFALRWFRTDLALGPANAQFFRYDPTLGGVHRNNASFRFYSEEIPNGYVTISTNNRGFREDERTPLKKRAAHRVIVFGDSHTDGVADNPDTFPNVAERELRDEGLDVEIINAGMMTYSPYQQALLFEQTLHLEPDLAVFTFYCGNDYLDLLSKSKPHIVADESTGAIVEYPPPAPPDKSFLESAADRSALVYALVSALSEPEPAATPPEKMRRALEIDTGAVWQSLNQGYKLPHRFEEASRLNAYVVDRIQRVAERESIAVSFLVLPTAYQIRPETAKEAFVAIEEIFGLNPEDKIDDRIAADVSRLATEHGIPVVNPSEPLASAPEAVYWRFDQHLNIEGCRIVGEALAKHLHERLGSTTP